MILLGPELGGVNSSEVVAIWADHAGLAGFARQYFRIFIKRFKEGIDMDALDEETLFVGTAEAEHVEMYLKAIWHIKERGEDVKISTIAKMLNVRQPSVVQMLKKLNLKNLVNYNKAGVRLTEDGERIGSSMMRNSRLLEVLMDSALKVEIDEEMVCGIEHHMNKQFTDALCIMLKHPRKCPHDHEIPMGECCNSA